MPPLHLAERVRARKRGEVRDKDEGEWTDENGRGGIEGRYGGGEVNEDTKEEKREE